MQIFRSSEEPERNSETWGRGPGGVFCGVKATLSQRRKRGGGHPEAQLHTHFWIAEVTEEARAEDSNKNKARCDRSSDPLRPSQTPTLSRQKTQKTQKTKNKTLACYST